MTKLGCVILLVLGACGGGGSGDDTPGVDAPATVDAPIGTPDADQTGWSMLIHRTWTLPAGTELYKCTRIRVEQDTYVQGFRSQAPTGSHHAVLTIANTSSGPLGDYDCSVGTLDLKMLYASGVGTDDLVFPDDVGVFLPAGTYLNLNLHLFNASDAPISGDSGVLVKMLAAAPPTLADMTFAGDQQLAIPSNGLPHDEVGGCTLNRSYTVAALWPHMHQFATHQKVELTHGGTTTTLLDDDFAFANQRNYPQSPPIQLTAGDQLAVTCTYVNNSGSEVNFGDSSTAEMCFVGMYRYPAPPGSFLFECVSNN